MPHLRDRLHNPRRKHRSQEGAHIKSPPAPIRQRTRRTRAVRDLAPGQEQRGAGNAAPEAVVRIAAALGPLAFAKLRPAEMPAWTAGALNAGAQELFVG